MVEMVQAALREVDLSPEQASTFKAAGRCIEAPSLDVDGAIANHHQH
jgi:hypothetical protein